MKTRVKDGASCPVLHRLRGAMGKNDDGSWVEPGHLFKDRWGRPLLRCRHCGDRP